MWLALVMRMNALQVIEKSACMCWGLVEIHTNQFTCNALLHQSRPCDLLNFLHVFSSINNEEFHDQDVLQIWISLATDDRSKPNARAPVIFPRHLPHQCECMLPALHFRVPIIMTVDD